jgi:hypothetical protein
MQPSNETEAEALQRRQVEALEAIAEHLEMLAGAAEHLETLASAVQPGGTNGDRRWRAFLRTEISNY